MASTQRVSPQKLKLSLLSARSHASAASGPASARATAGSSTARYAGGATTTRSSTVSVRPSQPSRPCLEFLPLGGMLRLKLTPEQHQQPTPKSLSSVKFKNQLDAATSDYLNDLAVLAEACRRGDKPQAEARAYLAMATTYEQLGLWEQAIQHFSKYRKVCQRLEDKPGQALALNRIGIAILKFDRSKVSEATHYHREHLKVAEGGYPRFVAYTNIGLLYQEKGASLQAQENEKADAIRSKYGHNAVKVLSTLNKKPQDHQQEGTNNNDKLEEKRDAPSAYRKALICHQKALDAALQDYNRESETIAVANLSVVNFQLGDATAAFGLAERCLKLSNKLQNVSYIIRSTHNVAVATHKLSIATQEPNLPSHRTEPDLPNQHRNSKQTDHALPASLQMASQGGCGHASTSNKGPHPIHTCPYSQAKAKELFLEAAKLAQEAGTDELAQHCRHSVAIAAVTACDVDEKLEQLKNIDLSAVLGLEKDV